MILLIVKRDIHQDHPVVRFQFQTGTLLDIQRGLQVIGIDLRDLLQTLKFLTCRMYHFNPAALFRLGNLEKLTFFIGFIDCDHLDHPFL